MPTPNIAQLVRTKSDIACRHCTGQIAFGEVRIVHSQMSYEHYGWWTRDNYHRSCYAKLLERDAKLPKPRTER